MSTNVWDGIRYVGKWLSGTTLSTDSDTVYIVIPIVSGHDYQVTCVTASDRYRWVTFAANPHDSTANGIRSVYSNDSTSAGTVFTFTAASGENYLMCYIGHVSASPSGSNAKVTVYDNTVINHKTSGSAVYTVPGITGTAASSMIAWTEDKPAGTSVAVSVSTDGSNYSPVTNGGQFLPPGSYDNTTAYIKIELTTTDATLTPTVSSLHFALQTVEDTYSIILEMEPLQRFESAAGPITVAYDGGGTLIGEGGAVLAFTQNFTPTGLVPKPHQNDAEHIEISIAATGTLTKIYYTDTAAQDQGHIEIAGITATGTLTKVSDI